MAEDCETGRNGTDRMPPGGDLEVLTRRLVEFRDERDWRRFHGLKNLIASVAIEAGELLELVQWRTDAEIEAAVGDEDFRCRLEEEAADVFLYLLLVCERAGIDLAECGARKIDKNAEKYPVALSRGSARKYTEL